MRSYGNSVADPGEFVGFGRTPPPLRPDPGMVSRLKMLELVVSQYSSLTDIILRLYTACYGNTNILKVVFASL